MTSDVAKDLAQVPGNSEADCAAHVSANLRAMIFKHFVNVQVFENGHGHPLTEKMAQTWAHMLAIVLKESGGDSTNVTDMKGREVGTYKAMTNLKRWRAIFAHSLDYNKQTNFGLAQQSVDRLSSTFKVSSAGLDDFISHKGEINSGADTIGFVQFYQQFAQGRTEQSERPIKLKDLQSSDASSELKARSHRGVQYALWHCGTRFLFEEGRAGIEGQKALENAMASIAYCDMSGDDKDATSKCFAKWLTLCPSLNIDIALLSPDSYFQTRRARPVCAVTFKKLLRK